MDEWPRRPENHVPEVTIFDDGLDMRGIPMPFDFEGQPKQRVAIVDGGICGNPVYDSHTAKPPSGSEVHRARHAGIGGWCHRSTAVKSVFTAGTSSVEEMIRSTKRGLYITRFWYTRHVHPRDVVVTGMTRDGTFLIEDGEIVGATKSMRFTQSYLDALAGTAAVGDRLRVMKVGGATISVPAVKLDRFRFTSVTRMIALPMILLVASTIAAGQGNAVRLTMPNEAGISEVEIQWQKKDVPYVRAGSDWVTVIGVDLDVKAGSYPSTIRVTKHGANGDVIEKRTVTIVVNA